MACLKIERERVHFERYLPRTFCPQAFIRSARQNVGQEQSIEYRRSADLNHSLAAFPAGSIVTAAVAPGLREALGRLDPATDPKFAPIPVLYVSCDGTPMRREELQGIKSKQQDGSARTREAKPGCVFTQTTRDAEGKPLRDPGSTSYTGTYQGCREVAVLLRQEARRRGLERAKQVVSIGNGAAWIWENCRLTCHSCESNGMQWSLRIGDYGL